MSPLRGWVPPIRREPRRREPRLAEIAAPGAEGARQASIRPFLVAPVLTRAPQEHARDDRDAERTKGDDHDA